MKGRCRRFAGVVAALAFLLAGLVHHDTFGPLARGTVISPVEHAAAPAVAGDAGPCVACALAALTSPAALPAFDVPPLVRAIPGLRSDEPWAAPDTPEIPGRSPPHISA